MTTRLMYIYSTVALATATVTASIVATNVLNPVEKHLEVKNLAFEICDYSDASSRYSFEDFIQTALVSQKKSDDNVLKDKTQLKPKPKVKLTLNSLKNISNESLAYISDKSGIPTKTELNELSSIYQIPEGLLYSVMLKESSGNTYAESSKNAKGLFQFTPETAMDFGLIKNGVDNRTNEWLSADASARYLSWIFTYFHSQKDRSVLDNYKYTLAAYNAGIGKVKKGNTLSIPPYRETQNYVKYIMGHTKGIYYRVKRGDSFRFIAGLHGLTELQLTRLNKGVKQETLIADKYLLIDKTASESKHVVRVGDSLYAIARSYKMTVADLKSINRLSSNLIGIGQELTLPF